MTPPSQTAFGRQGSQKAADLSKENLPISQSSH